MHERAELHCHTKMSEMSGLADVRELIQKADEMGMSAIALTDTDSVQAFPEAYRTWCHMARDCSGEKNTVKVLLGLETCLVDDKKADDLYPEGHKAIIFPTNPEGMVNLYRIISEVYSELCDGCIKIPKSMFAKKKDWIIGSCAQGGEVSRAVFDGLDSVAISRIIGFYDFVEVEPVDNYIYAMTQNPTKMNLTQGDVRKIIEKIVQIGETENVSVVASANVHYVNKRDIEAFKVLRYASGCGDSAGLKAKHHLMSVKELLAEFDFLGEKSSIEIVVNNPNRIAAEIGVVQPVSNKKCYPEYPDADLKLEKICYKKAHEIYGDKLPAEVRERIEYELAGIKANEFSSLYMIAYELVKKSNDAGYPVASRGCCGGSFIAFLAGITGINPLPAHYLCRNCKRSFFGVKDINGYRYGDLGSDLPDKACPVCGRIMTKEGFDIPAETFLGLHLDKEPYFAIDFDDEYIYEAQRSAADIEGIGRVCYGGRYFTVDEDQAEKYAKEYFKAKKRNRSKECILKAAEKIAGVRSDNSLCPAVLIAVPQGVDLCEYTPVVDCGHKDMDCTLIEYHELDGNLLRLGVYDGYALSFLRYLADETGTDPNDIEFGADKKVMSLFFGTEALGIEPEDIKGITVGTVGIPEYGYDVLKVLERIKPNRVTDVVRIASMLHGVQVWDGNAEKLIREDPGCFPECIASREDIMLYLIGKGLEREKAFKIMEYVRKGKARYGFKEDWVSDMQEAGIPDWYIYSCRKIKYLFPKAHCVNSAIISWRLLYYKLYYPEAFYRGYIKYYGFEALIKKGVEYANIYASYEYDKRAKRKKGLVDKLIMQKCLVIMEMHARGVGLE